MMVTDPGKQDTRPNVILTASLLACLLVAVAVRFYHLDYRSMSHPESHLPGIEMPDYVHQPPQRMTVTEVLHFQFYDLHPPGYDVAMLPWVRLFGTEMWTMRFPFALSGVLAVWLTYVVARRIYGPGVAVLACGMLAMHGYHVFWSQNARPWVFVTFWTVASSCLLLTVEKRWRLGLAVCYALTAAFGMWLEYYCWLIFAAQILWVLFRNADRWRMPALIGAQTMAIILAAPMFMYIRYHLGRSSHIDDRFWVNIFDTLRFGNLFGQAYVVPWAVAYIQMLSIPLAVVGGGLLALGLVGGAAVRAEYLTNTSYSKDHESRFPVYLLIAAAVAEMAVVEFFFSSHQLINHGKLYLLAMAAPWAFIVCWFAAEKTWPLYATLFKCIRRIPAIGGMCLDPIAIQLIFPYLVLGILCLFKPIISAYALISFLPLVLILMARGIMRLGRLRTVAIAAVICLFAFSVCVTSQAREGGPDYKGLATKLIPQIHKDDAVLVRSAFWVEPIHYYLKPGQFNVKLAAGMVGCPGTQPQPAFPLPDRVWIVEFGPQRIRDTRINEIAAKSNLTNLGFVEVMKLSAHDGGAALYERR